MAAMKKADETDSDKADPLIEESLSECTSAQDWLIGLREYPGVMGLTDQADLGSDSLRVPCDAWPDTQVCTDAKPRSVEWLG